MAATSTNATILIGNNSQLGDSNSLSDGDGKGTLSGALSGVSLWLCLYAYQASRLL